MAEVMVAVDGTRIVTGPDYAGCGCLKVTQKRAQRAGHAKSKSSNWSMAGV